MNYQVRLKQGLGALLGVAMMTGIPSALTAAEKAPEAKNSEITPSTPRNFVLEMEVGGNTPSLAVLRSYDGHFQADLGDPRITLQLTFRDVTESGAVADYTFGIRHKIENHHNGKVTSYSFEEQMIGGSIYLARGEKTEVFRTVPHSLSFTLKEVGRSIEELKTKSMEAEDRKQGDEHRKVVIPPRKPDSSNAAKPLPRIRRVPSAPPVRNTAN